MMLAAIVMSLMMAAASCVPVELASRSLPLKSLPSLLKPLARTIPDSAVVDVAPEAEVLKPSARSIVDSISQIATNIQAAAPQNNETNAKVGEINDKVGSIAADVSGLKETLNDDLKQIEGTITSSNTEVVNALNAVGTNIVDELTKLGQAESAQDVTNKLTEIADILKSIQVALGNE